MQIHHAPIPTCCSPGLSTLNTGPWAATLRHLDAKHEREPTCLPWSIITQNLRASCTGTHSLEGTRGYILCETSWHWKGEMNASPCPCF